MTRSTQPDAILRALAVLLLVTAGAAPRGAAAADTARVMCLKDARIARNTCMRDATVHCDEAFKGDLGTCFGGGNVCLQGCIRDHERCIEEPLSKREGCRIACAADQKVTVQACKSKTDMQACQQEAKQKGAECKQRCANDANPARQRCTQTFNDCLNACAR